jgi:hypothetical protein
MNKVSKSPGRHSFQKDGYVKRQLEKGEELNEDYLNMFDEILKEHDQKFDDAQSRVNNLEYDLLTTDWILEKARNSETYSQNLYAALCNNEFQKLDVVPILKEDRWGCSWRYAGGIVADMREEGDYINWYCSGIGEGLGNGDVTGVKGYVSESVVTEEIMEDLKRLGWIVLDEEN